EIAGRWHGEATSDHDAEPVTGLGVARGTVDVVAGLAAVEQGFVQGDRVGQTVEEAAVITAATVQRDVGLRTPHGNRAGRDRSDRATIRKPGVVFLRLVVLDEVHVEVRVDRRLRGLVATTPEL